MALGVNQLIGFGASAATGSIATFTDCVNITATGSKLTGGGYAGYTIATKFLSPVLGASGSVARITMYGPASGSATINAVWIGQAATSGNAYNFDGGQVQVFFGGSASRTLGTAEVVLSDDIAFAITQSSPIIVAFNISSSPASNLVRSTGLTANYVIYEKAAAQEAAQTLKGGGYGVTGGVAHQPFKIEVA